MEDLFERKIIANNDAMAKRYPKNFIDIVINANTVFSIFW